MKHLFQLAILLALWLSPLAPATLASAHNEAIPATSPAHPSEAGPQESSLRLFEWNTAIPQWVVNQFFNPSMETPDPIDPGLAKWASWKRSSNDVLVSLQRLSPGVRGQYYQFIYGTAMQYWAEPYYFWVSFGAEAQAEVTYMLRFNLWVTLVPYGPVYPTACVLARFYDTRGNILSETTLLCFSGEYDDERFVPYAFTVGPAPQGTAKIELTFEGQPRLLTETIFRVDTIQAVPVGADPGYYVDGDMSGYVWEGVPHDSCTLNYAP